MDELLVVSGFTAYSKEMDVDKAEEILNQIYEEGYFDEVKDHLEDENMNLTMDIMNCGYRLNYDDRKQIKVGKLIFEGMSKNTFPMDKEEVINIFFNITDDFPDLQLTFYNCMF